MPLVKIFAMRGTSPMPTAALQRALCSVWGTQPSVTKLMVCLLDDWTTSGEDVFVDIRAKQTADRTRETVARKVAEVQQVFAQHGYKANVRVETYQAEQYFHLPPPS
ncbi:hypothetical protein KFE25_007604 [Diacronema lutheri]|uniref:Uncharacterized protein n=1 Tax=Diacronema lutheri TaxID=2081491 RepID=A0A8J6CFG1_DIALT|nr:hypothetical protein KFE25_007604 [Diacronema lutheri]